MSTGSLGGHGLADRQYCFHLRSSVTGHARFYKIIVVFSMSWYTDRKRTGNLKERKNYHGPGDRGHPDPEYLSGQTASGAVLYRQ